jgi:apolipoprotein N-acyltransferase
MNAARPADSYHEPPGQPRLLRLQWGLEVSLQRLRPAAACLLASATSGVLYAAAFPAPTVSAAAWCALVPLLFYAESAGRLGCISAGWIFAVIAGYAIVGWLPAGVATYYHQSYAFGVLFTLVGLSVVAAPYYIVFLLIYRRLAQRHAALSPVLASAAWVAVEFARCSLLTGCPWAFLGYSQVGWRAVIQIADLGGVYAVSFVVVAVNAALVRGMVGLATKHTARYSILVASGIVLLVLGYGHARLRNSYGVTESHRVAVVQANIPFEKQWLVRHRVENLRAYIHLTETIAHGQRTDVILWPENAIGFGLEHETGVRRAIASVLRRVGSELLVGGPRAEAAGRGVHHYNSAFLLSDTGAVAAIYDKQHLLPFAEYFPVPQLDFLRRRFGNIRTFAPGTQLNLIPTRAGLAGILICYETMFPQLARNRVGDGAQYLVSLANDSWLSSPAFAEQVLNMVTLRAVEQRRWLVRASTAGPSALIDPTGLVVQSTSPNSIGGLSGTIQPGTARTPYSIHGDAFAVCCLGLTLLGCVGRLPRAS